MSAGVFKAPKAIKAEKQESEEVNGQMSPMPKRRRTAEDFYTFCNYILEHEQYELKKQEELRLKNSSPLDSTGSNSGTESVLSEGPNSGTTPRSNGLTPDRKNASDLETGADYYEDSWDVVTCFCMKPFGGRPMIECSECLIWIHLSCAKIRKSNIPDVYICQRCRESRASSRKSDRVNKRDST
ncbi:PREDICTED: PHD finger protein 23-like [Priapulus caudatus]|uniref:PHD finger protein 23-like n=1 Tax=Priapulus caudatus TaxID=37621 RepID=A0ABM1DQI8_PRICU|nr:PREDICTED: PHD finger protein 23-like [Priapulus caudatus]